MSGRANALLERLERVTETGAGRWRARCPVHQGKSASLAIRQCDDGRVLVHCFAGCDVESVVTAVGLKLRDLMPPRALEDRIAAARQPWSPREVLEAVHHELVVGCLLMDAAAAGYPLSGASLERMATAARRLGDALELIQGRRPPELRTLRSGRTA